MSIEKRVEVLENLVASLTRRMNAREKGDAVTAATLADPETGEMPETMLFRGKYEGHTHASVVEKDPWYVQWLANEGKARGLGFSEEHIDAAINDPRPQPPRR